MSKFCSTLLTENCIAFFRFHSPQYQARRTVVECIRMSMVDTHTTPGEYGSIWSALTAATHATRINVEGPASVAGPGLES